MLTMTPLKSALFKLTHYRPWLRAARAELPDHGWPALPLAPMRPRAILFDYGGTLDGPASHWLPRFLQLYRRAGVELRFERFRAAFDHATRCGYADRRVAAL